MKKLYAIAISARRWRAGSVNIVTAAGYVVAASEDEAMGRGMRRARDAYPAAEGWSDHGVASCPVPAAVLEGIVEAKDDTRTTE